MQQYFLRDTCILKRPHGQKAKKKIYIYISLEVLFSTNLHQKQGTHAVSECFYWASQGVERRLKMKSMTDMDQDYKSVNVHTADMQES